MKEQWKRRDTVRAGAKIPFNSANASSLQIAAMFVTDKAERKVNKPRTN